MNKFTEIISAEDRKNLEQLIATVIHTNRRRLSVSSQEEVWRQFEKTERWPSRWRDQTTKSISSIKLVYGLMSGKLRKMEL